MYTGTLDVRTLELNKARKAVQTARGTARRERCVCRGGLGRCCIRADRARRQDPRLAVERRLQPSETWSPVLGRSAPLWVVKKLR